MTAARRLAHLRLLGAALAVAFPLLLPLGTGRLLRHLLPGTPWLPIASGVVMLLAGAAGFFYFTFRWRPRCPQCRASKARFTRADDQEYLACPSCGYRDATGYTWAG